MATANPTLSGVPFLVSSFVRSTFFGQEEVRLASGVSDFRVRRNAPPRYLSRISAASDDGGLAPLADLVGTDHFVARDLDQAGLYLFGPEVGGGIVSVRILSRGALVRNGPDDYRLEFSLALLDPVAPVVDPNVLKVLPFSYSISEGYADDTRNHFQIDGPGWNTSEGVPVLRTTLRFPILREEELGALRAWYFHGVKSDLFSLALNVPIFGPSGGYSWSVRVVSLDEAFSGGGLSSASLVLERSR